MKTITLRSFLTSIGIVVIGGLLALCLPLLAKALSGVPTDYGNSVTGRLSTQITTTATTITVTADTIKTPAGTSSVTWVTGKHILRLSRKAGNKTWIEYIGVESATQSDATVTLSGVTRYLSSTDGSDFSSQGAGLAFPSGSIVELIWGVHHAEGAVLKSASNELTGSGQLTGSATTLDQAHVNFPPITTTQRDAFTTTNEGDMIYNSTVTAYQQYIGGAWVQASSGSVTNAGYANSGKVECLTATEILAGTASGSTNAPGVVCGADVVTEGSATSTGRLVALTGATFDNSVIPQIPVAKLNNGTSASSSTFWRGDGTWAAPSIVALRTLTGSSTNGADFNSSTAKIAMTGNYASFTIPANTVAQGDVLRITASGYFRSDVSGLDFYVNLGGQDLSRARVTTALAANSAWSMRADITARTTTSAIIGGTLAGTGAGDEARALSEKTSTSLPPTAETVNFAANQVLQIKGEFDGSNANHTVVMDTLTVTLIKAP